MDPLALLSNLHGDGPSTLSRLRRFGCDTLAGLLASPPGELAPILGWDAARTERFQREAEVLARRLGDGLLDVEEDASEPVAPEPKRALGVLDPEDDEDEDEGAETAADVGSSASERAAAEGEEAVAVATGEAAAAGDDDEAGDEAGEDEEAAAELPVELREEVLTRWRTLDASESQAGGKAAPRASDTLVPRAARRSSAQGRPLAAAAIDGLDPVRIRALQVAGFATVEALAAADDLEVHRATGLPYTVASRLTFLARRAAAKTSTAPARPPATRSDAGGPFA